MISPVSFHIYQITAILNTQEENCNQILSINKKARKLFIKLSCFLFMEYYFEAFTISINSFSASTASARPREFFITKPSKDFNAFSLPPK